MRRAKWWRTVLTISACVIGAGFLVRAVLSKLQPPVKKETVMVPMRDGVRLATDIYFPEGDGPFPVILLRSPYDRKLGEGIAQDAARRDM
jgi:predicted acyl esterase